MANILIIPASGAIIFDSQSAGSSGISSLTGAPRLLYDNAGGLNITSYTTGSGTLDRFTVDGAYGRLFGVSDSVTGTIFSVNDAAGLPVIEVESNLTDKITMGTYGTNTLVVDNVSVGIGTGTPSGKLHIVDTTLAGTGSLSGSALNIQQTWNTSAAPTAIKLNVIDTASNAASNLMDLQVSGVSRFKIDKSLLENCPNLKCIGRVGAGMENIDLVYAKERGIVCLCVPEGNRDAVGEHALGMLLMLFNNLKKAKHSKWLDLLN